MKKAIRISIFFSLLFLFSTPWSGIIRAENVSHKTPPVNEKIIQGIHLLYDWKFLQAESLFQKVIEENPEEPIGYFYLAMVTWSKLASGFWSPEVVELYRDRIDQVISISQTRINGGTADSQTFLYLGGALGFKGRFMLMQRRWVSSFFLALDAIEALQTCQKMDPNNKDVLFGLGIFDYYTARLSGTLKFLTYLLLHKGDKEEGLRKLHAAAQGAVYASIEAKSLLAHVYLFMERDHYKALPLIKEMAQKFKNDPRNKYFEGVVYFFLGMDFDYHNTVKYFYARSSIEKSPEIASIWFRRALYMESSYHLFHEECDLARSKLKKILENTDPVKDPFMIAWPLVKVGMSYDLELQREKALEYYQRVLSMKNGAGAQFLAEKYINKPVKKRESFLAY